MSAVVQMMVFSKTSGVMFTVNVATGDDNNILIEAAFGLGNMLFRVLLLLIIILFPNMTTKSLTAA